jgi:hypothetical protein
MSDLQRRSEALLRQRGYLTGSVERRKRFPAHSKPACKACGTRPMVDIASDLWNVFDLIAVKSKKELDTEGGGYNDVLDMVFVQVTSSANHATRRNKIIASAEAKLSILAGAHILIQSWRKKDNRWQAVDEWISLDQFVGGLPDTVAQYYADQARLNLLDRKKKLPAFPPGATLPLSDMLKDEKIPF